MVGYLPCVLNSTTNDIRCLSFGRHVTVGDVAPKFHKVGGRCYPWAVVSFRKWSFASMGGCFCCRRSFVFVSGRCRSFAFVGGRLRSWAVVFVGDCRWRWAQCGGCRRWRRYAVVVVTNMVVGGGKKNVAVFVKYDAKQTLFVVCYK